MLSLKDARRVDNRTREDGEGERRALTRASSSSLRRTGR